MKKTLIALMSAVLLFVCVFASGSKDSMASGSNDMPSVVTTIFPVYDFARAVMFGSVDMSTGKTTAAVSGKNLKLLVKPGMEIHSYDPSPADIAAIQKADIFIYIGGDSDEWVRDVLASMDTSHKTVIRLMDCVETVEEEIVEGMEHSHEGHEFCDGSCEHEEDEHIWTSPAYAQRIVDLIADALIQADKNAGAVNAARFAENAQAYKTAIQNVDSEIRTVIDGAQNKYILMGDRFPLRYFADYYGLTYSAAFTGCSTAVEANPATIAFLIDKAAEKQVPAVFAIELSNQKIARTIAEGAMQKNSEAHPAVLELHTVHNVTKDDFKAGETWVSLMKRNVETLKKGMR